MGPPTSGDGKGNLNIERNWLFDMWGIPWFEYGPNYASMAFPQTVQNFAPPNFLINFACSAHPEPFNLPQPVFINLTPSQAIPEGTTTINLSGKILAGQTIPTGTVSITINGVVQSAAIDATGGFTSVFATTSIPGTTNPYIIIYQYVNSNFDSATDETTTLTVESRTTVLTLSVDNNTPAYGQTITLTVHGKSPVGIPAGTVTFLDNAGAIGTSTFDSQGQATLSTSLSGGFHQLSASYAGQGTNDAGVSPLVNVTVTAEPTSLSASNPSPIAVGAPAVHLAGQISGKVGTQVGYPAAGETVTITIGTSSQVTTLQASGLFALDFPTANLAIGIYHPIKIVYAGDTNFAALSDSSLQLGIGQIASVFSTLTPSQTMKGGTASVQLSGGVASLNGVTPTGVVAVTVTESEARMCSSRTAVSRSATAHRRFHPLRRRTRLPTRIRVMPTTPESPTAAPP